MHTTPLIKQTGDYGSSVIGRRASYISPTYHNTRYVKCDEEHMNCGVILMKKRLDLGITSPVDLVLKIHTKNLAHNIVD